jgi:hypothetical protein
MGWVAVVQRGEGQGWKQASLQKSISIKSHTSAHLWTWAMTLCMCAVLQDLRAV